MQAALALVTASASVLVADAIASPREGTSGTGCEQAATDLPRQKFLRLLKKPTSFC